MNHKNTIRASENSGQLSLAMLQIHDIANIIIHIVIDCHHYLEESAYGELIANPSNPTHVSRSPSSSSTNARF